MGLCPNIAFLGISWHSGAFSRYVNVYDYMCYNLPPEVSYEVGALVEPFAATYRAVKQANVEPDETVAIVGTGPIGLMALRWGGYDGAGQVVACGPAAHGQELPLECGATAVINTVAQDPVKAIGELTGRAGADAVV